MSITTDLRLPAEAPRPQTGSNRVLEDHPAFEAPEPPLLARLLALQDTPPGVNPGEPHLAAVPSCALWPDHTPATPVVVTSRLPADRPEDERPAVRVAPTWTDAT